MVTAQLAAIGLVLALAGTARADENDAGFNMLSVDSSLGALRSERVSSLGLAVEHPVWRTVRVVAAYDWMWVGDASGQRATLALRRELFGSGHDSRTFVDGEVGGSFAMLTRPEMGGVDLLPAGFLGLRFGWDVYETSRDSPSSTFETAIAVRVLAVDHGAGVTGGLTFAWGN